MGIRTILKKGLKKADQLVDKEADRMEIVSESLTKASSLIQEDAKVFAKNTYKNLKSVAEDLSDISKDATKEIRSQLKKDVVDVKEIAEKRMIETRDVIIDKLESKSENNINESEEEKN